MGRTVALQSLVLVTCLGLGALAGCGTAEEASARPRTIVLVTIDTLRADHLSFDPAEGPATPFLDSLAAHGVVYERAYAPSSWTVPSMASIFTAVEPRAHGVTTGNIRRSADGSRRVVQDQPILPASYVTLAEALGQAGYRTVGVPSNLHLGKRQGFRQGFDHYYDQAKFLPAEKVNDKTVELLEEAWGAGWRDTWKEGGTFLWVHYFDPHAPYMARQPWIDTEMPDFGELDELEAQEMIRGLDHSEFQSTYLRDMSDVEERLLPLYRTEISYVDDYLRQLNEAIGYVDDDVLLIVTSDHGEEFYDHQRFGHAATLFEETIRVPLLLRWPGEVEGGRRNQDTVSILDVYPTVTDLLGLPRPVGGQGRSLPALLDAEPFADRPMYFHTDHVRPPIDAVRQGPWKLIRRGDLPRMLFNLEDDPQELTNVAPDHPEIAERLEKLLDDHLAALPAPPADSDTVEIGDEESLDQLRDTGYIGDD